MFNLNQYIMHFVSDLRRAVFCLTNQDLEGVSTFLNHAHDLYEKQLKINGQQICDDFDSHWLGLYNTAIPVDTIDRKRFADKILTLSSIIYLRNQK